MVPFRSLFFKRIFARAMAVLVGAMLTVRFRTVAAVLRAVGLAEETNFSSYHRVLSRARWSAREGARRLLRQLVERFVPEGPVIIGVDDTIERRRGPKIKARGIYRDPTRSSKGHFVKALCEGKRASVAERATAGGDPLGFSRLGTPVSDDALSLEAILGRSGPSTSVPDSVRGHLSLFILAGQSNMVGQAPIRPEDRTPIPSVWLFGNDYRWHRAQAPLDNPYRQVDLVSKDEFVGVGPGLFFASQVRSYRTRNIGLIPCANGGSSIAAWQPARSDATLYGSCLKRARAASTMGEIVGILFYQGETDALSPEDYPHRSINPHRWKHLFVDLAQAWRRDFHNPRLPIIFAQIGSHTASKSRFPHWTCVQKQQAKVSLPQTAMVQTQILPLRDNVHLTRSGYRTVGQRMANAWQSLTLGAD